MLLVENSPLLQNEGDEGQVHGGVWRSIPEASGPKRKEVACEGWWSTNGNRVKTNCTLKRIGRGVGWVVEINISNTLKRRRCVCLLIYRCNTYIYSNEVLFSNVVVSAFLFMGNTI